MEKHIKIVDEVDEENLERLLMGIEQFVEFFNSFLSLPAFPQRLIYNSVNGCFEQFQNILTNNVDEQDKVNQAANVKTDLTFFKSTIGERKQKIGFYVKFHDRDEGLQWVKVNRLALFQKSEIYADFKLSRLLYNEQYKFIQNLLKDEIDVPLKAQLSEFQSMLQTAELSYTETPIEVCNRIETLTPEKQFSEHPLSYAAKPLLRLDESTNNTSSDIVHDGYPTIPLWRTDKNLDRDGVVTEEEIKTKRQYHTEVSRNLSLLPEQDKTIKSKEYTRHGDSVDVSLRSSMASDEFLYEKTLQSATSASSLTTENVKLFSQLNTQRTRHEDVKLYLGSSTTYTSFDCDYNAITKPLGASDQQTSRIDEAGLLNDFMRDSTACPINLLCKDAFGAFKEFLFESSGERNLLLWLEVERTKYYTESEIKRTLMTIKERFMRAGSPHEIAQPILKNWGINDISSLTIDMFKLNQKKILDPLLKYWVQRFTIHQYKKKRKLFAQAFTTVYVRFNDNVVFKEENLPHRPKSCMNHIKTTQQEISVEDNDADSGVFMLDENYDFKESGLTRKKLRAKTAFPRLISTKKIQHTNVGAEQLQLLSSYTEKGFGFQPINLKFYPNDASDVDYKNSVRLYIRPVPGLNAAASTIVSTPVESSRPTSQEEETKEHLDSLVDSLLHERFTGSYFLQYLRKHENKLWLNSYYFWLNLQEYNEYFYAATFAPLAVQRKANMIYTKYVAMKSESDIQCPTDIQNRIYAKLDPPYEDLFDEIEYVILSRLVQPWLSLKVEETNRYEKLPVQQQLKFIEIGSTSKYKLQNEFEELENFHDSSDNDDNKISPEEILQPLPSSKDGFNFQELLRNKTELQHFQTFLQTKHKQGIVDLTAWTDMEIFRRLPPAETADESETRNNKAKEIKERWLNKDYFFGSTTPATKAARRKFLEDFGENNVLGERPSSPSILEAQKYARARVERRWLLLFKQTKEYLDRHKKKNNMAELVEDLLMKKKLQRSEQAWKILNSRWNVSSLDVSSLRLTLADMEKREYLRRFVSSRGDMMEQNFNFWLEVQKYKGLCHSHIDNALIRAKVQTIIDVFIKSSIPPELQIDIPIEMAERLQEKIQNYHFGPYLFREAQATVFRIIFNYWKDFCMFREEKREGVTMSDALTALEEECKNEKLKKKMIEERKRLGKVVNEKRRKEYLSKERGRAKGNDLLSFVTRTITPSDVGTSYELDGNVTTFVYSKHTAEDQLNELEQKMTNEGLLIYSDDARTSRVTSCYHSMDENSTVTSKTTKYRSNRSGNSVFNQRRLSVINSEGAIGITKLSQGDGPVKTEGGLKLCDDFYNGSRLTLYSRRPSVTFKLNDQDALNHGRNRCVFGKSLSQSKKSSDVTALRKVKKREQTIKDNNLNEMDTCNPGKTLTARTLKEFEKSPQGKPLAVPLPLTRIAQERLHDSKSAAPILPSIELTKDSPKESRKNKRNLLAQFRLPRNAGTASILQKVKKTKPRIDSPSPEIIAEVVVC